MLALGDAGVEMPELARERLVVGPHDPHLVGPPVGATAAVDGRALLQPRRRELERANGVREEERDRLAVLERVEELDPRPVYPSSVLQPEGAVDRAALVPPVAPD